MLDNYSIEEESPQFVWSNRQDNCLASKLPGVPFHLSRLNPKMLGAGDPEGMEERSCSHHREPASGRDHHWCKNRGVDEREPSLARAG